MKLVEREEKAMSVLEVKKNYREAENDTEQKMRHRKWFISLKNTLERQCQIKLPSITKDNKHIHLNKNKHRTNLFIIATTIQNSFTITNYIRRFTKGEFVNFALVARSFFA